LQSIDVIIQSGVPAALCHRTQTHFLTQAVRIWLNAYTNRKLILPGS